MIHHLKSLRLTTFIITVGFVLNGSMIPGWWTPAKAVAQTDSQITILDANQRGILLELQVNDFKVEQIHKAGELFSRVQIGTMAQTNLPGLPQVPTEGTLLGVPIPEGLSLQIVETDYQTLIGHRLLPAPQLRSQSDEPDGFAQATFQERFMLDAQRDAKDSVYPHAVAEIGEVGYLRDQAVAQIQFYPVQHNPQRNELRIYHHIRVQLTWNRPPADAVTNVRWHSRPYETLFSELLQNYRWLPQPKVYPTTNTIARSTNIEGGYSTNCVNCRSQSERNRITTQFGIPPIEANQTGSLPALKIYVIEEGLYRLTYLNLLNAGFDPGIHNLHTFKLYNQGVEIPIYVDGEYNGVFDPDDSIYFYGAAIDNDYTTRNVYWLVADGSIGRRMAVQSGLIAGNGAFVHRFLATEHIEEDTVYWQNMPGRNQDRWFWGQRLSPDTEGMDSSRTFSIRVDNIATEGEANRAS
ncbi:hypothetical protein KFU94_47665 [Chloroflexi bacterium TSY]|nr:hypothetical protein [Chloroflexi bacterium TSY]